MLHSRRHQFAHHRNGHSEILRHPCGSKACPDGGADHTGLRRRDVRRWCSFTDYPWNCRARLLHRWSGFLAAVVRLRNQTNPTPPCLANRDADQVYQFVILKLADILREIGKLHPLLLTVCSVTVH